MKSVHEHPHFPSIASENRANFVELTPLSFLTRAATAFGDRIAVVEGDRRFTYREFHQRVCRQASALRAAGIEPGDRVAVLAPNSRALLESHFGVPLAGAILVALNTRLAPPEYAYILDHSGAKILIVDAELAPLISPILDKCPGVRTIITVAGGEASDHLDHMEYESFLESGTMEISPAPVHENAPISICYTSGTTGRPKGAVYTHRGAYLNGLSVALELRLSQQSVYLWTLPMFHTNGWCTPWAVTAVGGRHIILRKIDPPLVWDLITREGVTHFCAAPTVLIMLANSPPTTPHRSAQPVLAATGGAPPSPTIIEQMMSLGVEITHLYGLTETYGPCLSCAWWPEWDALPAAEQAGVMARQGVRMVGVGDARVVDEHLMEVAADGQTMGELVVRSNTVVAGYFKDEERTAEAFRGGWFHTGDLGVRHPNNYIELRDRAKDIIISGGENISSVEVEQAVARHPAVYEAAVVGMPDEKWGEVPKAFVQLKPGAQVTAEEIIEFVRSQLARFKAPKAVEFGELPRTSSGKIQKYQLREQTREGHEKRVQ